MSFIKARLYTEEDKGIRCGVCPHRCLLKEGMKGICGARQVKDGELYVFNYGLVAAAAVDPMEKKPLYHFYPGRDILSLGTCGCNFQCIFCQNWSLASTEAAECREAHNLQPADVLELLNRRYPSSVGIAYTYNEPAIWFEYVCDTAALIKKHGYRNVLVTNGFITPEALEELSPHIDALNIDVKSFRNDFYHRYCKGDLEPVKKTVEYCARNFHLEVTCLIIPTLNDSREEIQVLVDWLAGLSPHIPLHFSRYFPHYQLSLPPTPVETLERALKQAREKLHYVYIGNLAGKEEYINTYCPYCDNLLIRRSGYRATSAGLSGKLCTQCGKEIHLLGDFSP